MEQMDLVYSRNDIFQVAPQARKTLRVLPPGKSKTQKLVIGDQNGAVSCIGMKKGEVSVS